MENFWDCCSDILYRLEALPDIQPGSLRTIIIILMNVDCDRYVQGTCGKNVRVTGGACERCRGDVQRLLFCLQLIDADEMLFNDDTVRIEPVEGDVWPHSSAEVTVIFRPDAASQFQRTAFCDVTGRESRLPLRVRGCGIGARVTFSCDVVDTGRVFVFSSHCYELVLANTGPIDAIFTLLQPTSAVGRCFQFNPSEGILMPGGHQAISVMLNCQVIGDFEEDFSFQIDGSPTPAKVVFR